MRNAAARPAFLASYKRYLCSDRTQDLPLAQPTRLRLWKWCQKPLAVEIFPASATAVTCLLHFSAKLDLVPHRSLPSWKLPPPLEQSLWCFIPEYTGCYNSFNSPNLLRIRSTVDVMLQKWYYFPIPNEYWCQKRHLSCAHAEFSLGWGFFVKLVTNCFNPFCVKPPWTNVTWKVLNSSKNNEPDPCLESDGVILARLSWEWAPLAVQILTSAEISIPWRFITDVRDETPLLLLKALFFREFHTKQFTQERKLLSN